MISLKIFLKNSRYFASAFFFSGFSLILSTWFIYIPYVSDKLGISEGEIGIAILFSAIGALVIIPLTKYLIDRIGEGKMAFFSQVLYSVISFGPFIAPTYNTLCAALFLLGMGGSILSLSINSLIPAVEKEDNVYIMSGSHGFFSVGGMIGAGAGSFIASVIQFPVLHIGAVNVIIITIQLIFRKKYFYVVSKKTIKEKVRKKQSVLKPLFLIVAVGVILMVSEGAIADWSALYLRDVAKTKLSYIGLGYSGFSLFMAIGRFLGDWGSKKFGSWQLITINSIIAIAGFLIVLYTGNVFSIAGFAIVGLGFSAIVPEVFRLASYMENIDVSTGISFLTAATYVGFMAGPVFLGFLAEFDSLHLSFRVVTLMIIIVFILSVYSVSKLKKSAA